jgi:hypothetical protein
MFKPCDAVLCFYILLGQQYTQYHNHNETPVVIVMSEPMFLQEPKWYENKALITNDNLFDINKLIKIEDSSQ